MRCDRALDPGCEKYFCTLFHWHDHWDEHDSGVQPKIASEEAREDWLQASFDTYQEQRSF